MQPEFRKRATSLRVFAAAALIVLATSSASAQLSPDDVDGARRLLRERGAHVHAGDAAHAGALMRAHRYQEAQQLVEAALSKAPTRELRELKVRLLIQEWRLDEALQLARSIPNHALVARVQLLKQDFDGALTAAKLAQQSGSVEAAEGHLVEAEVHFWRERPDLAEAPLRRALDLDPLNADARFAYGYAIWRRLDARQLPAMAAQWNLALEIDPLHYVTHWHFGNGHTHLTYADYAQPSDSIVRVRLRGVDSLVANGRLQDALTRTRALQAEYAQSLLPTLARGSIFYMSADLPRAARLDSAQMAFMDLLRRKPNYGPAHNALAAVIKQRQFTYHAKFDSLEAEIARQPMPTDSAFYRVFKNIRYYPGDRVVKMAVQQLGPAMAYIPFLARLGYTYTIPPLHQDLSEAMNSPFYRTSTTFDNRQWMDIRGSGGNHAAAGIEYVERGSHQERVVLLHEYVHQFHGAVLTDQQVRRIRQLYYDAMANKRTLDYYAGNNESEFFAQSYEAYLSPVKVHPLTHKAMVTRAQLIRKDPALFAFIDTVVAENRAYLAGDRNAMKRNWAQVYVTLARQARNVAARGGDSLRWRRPEALLDTALSLQPTYVPALLEKAELLRAQRRWDEAEAVLHSTSHLAPRHAPVLTARAELWADRERAGRSATTADDRIALYRQALQLENDLSERAELNRALRELYHDHARFNEALQVTDDYVASAPTLSTYLRDRRDEAAAFAAELQGTLGQTAQAMTFFDTLLARKPQHFAHRAQAARVLLLAGQPDAALRIIEEGRRLLRAAGQRRNEYTILEAEALAALQQVDSAKALLRGVLQRNERRPAEENIHLITALASIGLVAEADSLLRADTATVAPRLQAERLYLRGLLHQQRQELEDARRLYVEVLRINPLHNRARVRMTELKGTTR